MKDIREKKFYGFSLQTLKNLCRSVSNIHKSNASQPLAILFTVVLIFAWAAPILVQSESSTYNSSIGQNNNSIPIPIMTSQNPEFINYINNASVGKPVSGIVPTPTLIGNYSFTNYTQQSLTMFPNDLLLPMSYDLRQINKVTPVKSQSVNGIIYQDCWAFATDGSLESNLMPNQQWNFSENNLINKNGFDISQPNGGGDSRMSTAYLTRWSGPVSASQDPYYHPTSPSGLTTQAHVQNVYYIPPRQTPSDNDNIKSAIYNTQTGLYANMYWDPSYLNSNGAYYYHVSGTTLPNHAVTIVGWDDTYLATNFKITPPGPGAFIVKDSKGTSEGDNGYIYVSYYDDVIGTNDNAIFTAEPTTNYDNNYQYDPLGWDGNLGYIYPNGSMQNYAYMGDIYNTNNNPVKSEYEYVDAVGFYTYTTNANYRIIVYDNPTNGPSSGTQVGFIIAGTITGPPGYYTVKLAQTNGLTCPVRIPSGDKFSIVLYLQTPGYNYPISIEYPLSGYASQATANASESYISPDGTNWADITSWNSSTDVCLKAYTENNVIINGGFEQGWNNYKNWIPWTSGTSGSNEIVSNVSHHGTESLHLAKSGYTSGAFGVYTNMYNATSGNMSLQFWVKGNNSVTGTVYVKLQAYNSQGTYIGGGQWPLGNVPNWWCWCDDLYNMPAGTAQVSVTISVQGNVDLNFDDFELYKADTTFLETS